MCNILETFAKESQQLIPFGDSGPVKAEGKNYVTGPEMVRFCRGVLNRGLNRGLNPWAETGFCPFWQKLKKLNNYVITA